MVQFAGIFFTTEPLNGVQWVWCLVLGCGALPWGIAVRYFIKPSVFRFLSDLYNGSSYDPDDTRAEDENFKQTKVFETFLLTGGTGAAKKEPEAKPRETPPVF